MNPARDLAAYFTRRDLLKSSAAIAAAGIAGGLVIPGTAAYGATSRGMGRIKVGLIGCGGRGRGAGIDALEASPDVQIWAVGDLFQDCIDGCVNAYTNPSEDTLKGLPDIVERATVPPERRFVGFDAYKKVIASGVDVVILATTPGFRPIHFAAAIEAGKHVFMEKPVAVDPAGVRTVIAAAEKAKEKKLSVVCGTQRRHQKSYIETIEKLKEGAIGTVLGGSCYWNQGGLWTKDRQPSWTDVEWQIRNWLYFTWLSGDHIVEQHVHNLDVMNWILGTPERCLGLGGRQVRTGPEYGHIYDHFAIEYIYPGGARVLSMCRQQPDTGHLVQETFVGSDGRCVTRDGPGRGDITGKKKWSFKGDSPPPYVQEHKDLFASITEAGPYLNEGVRIAESTLTAIMGRMSAYTGKEVKWEQALNSKLDLMPTDLDFGPMEVGPVPMPGQTPLV